MRLSLSSVAVSVVLASASTAAPAADPGYAIPPQSTPDCAFEVQVSEPRSHEDYRRYPTNEHDLIKPGERLRIAGVLIASQKNKIGSLQFTARDGNSDRLAVLLDGLSDQKVDYLRERCLEHMPCASVFQVTYLGKAKYVGPHHMETYHCVSSLIAYIQFGGRGYAATLDGWVP